MYFVITISYIVKRQIYLIQRKNDLLYNDLIHLPSTCDILCLTWHGGMGLGYIQSLLKQETCPKNFAQF